MKQRRLISLASVAIALVACKPSVTTPPNPSVGSSGVVVSPQTTRITAPLLPDGSVDYLAYLNQRASQGVTEDNNAAVILLGVLPSGDSFSDPTPGDLKYADALRAQIHAASFPPDEQFLPIRHAESRLGHDAGQKLIQFWNQTTETELGPWTEKDHPELAAWLKENEKAIAHIEQAVERDHCYVPRLAREDKPNAVLGDLYPWMSFFREINSLLIARAQFHLGQSDLPAFAADLETFRRLAMLISQQDSLILQLFGNSLLNQRAELIGKLLAAGKLPPAAIPVAQKAVAGPVPSFDPRVLDEVERFQLLAYMQKGPAGGYIKALTPAENSEFIHPPKLDPAVFADLNAMRWDLAMIAANQMMDRIVDIAHRPTHADVQRALEEFHDQCDAAGMPHADFYDLMIGLSLRNLLEEKPETQDVAVAYLKRHPDETIEAYSARMGTWIARVNDQVLSAKDLFDGGQMFHATVRVALAAAQYRQDHHAFPDQIADLVPNYLPELPPDSFSGGPLLYRKDGPDVIIYSVGVDGKDGEGKVLRIGSSGDIGVRIKGSAN